MVQTKQKKQLKIMDESTFPKNHKVYFSKHYLINQISKGTQMTVYGDLSIPHGHIVRSHRNIIQPIEITERKNIIEDMDVQFIKLDDIELRNLAVKTRDMLLIEHVELSDVDIPRQPINKTIGFKTN